MQTRLGYEQRAVAFLDILGWRRIVTQSEADVEALGSLGTALHLLAFPQMVLEANLRLVEPEAKAYVRHTMYEFSQFSDTIVLSAHADRDGIDRVVLQTTRLQQSLVAWGFLLRGALTIGPMYHVGSFAFGPALTEAYDVQVERAIYPRVVINPTKEKQFLDIENIYDGGSVVGRDKKFRKASDGLWFIDFLQPLGATEGVNNPHQPTGQLAGHFLNFAHRVATWGLKRYGKDNARIYAKYRWLAEYYNDLLTEYPDCGCRRIRLGTRTPPNKRLQPSALGAIVERRG